MTQLLDAYGRKVQVSELKEELAGPAIAGLRPSWWNSIANFLDPERLGAYLNELDTGNSQNYLILAYEMEERYHQYYSTISTRKIGVSSLPFNIEAASEDTDDKKAADLCREALNDEIMQPMLLDAMDAISKGFSVGEIMWETEGKAWYPREILNRDARWFRYDVWSGQELRRYDMADPGFGVPLEPFHFVKHEPKLRTGLPIKRGLARLGLIAYLMITFDLRDWLAFAQRFGMPLRVGKYPTTATKQERSALFNAISGMGVDSAGIIPSNMELIIESGGTRSGGEKIFAGLAEYMDRLISKVVLGQTSTTEGTAGKLGNEQSQERVREDIRTNDARQLAATIRRDLIRPLVDLNMGPRDRNHYPKATLEEKKPEDLAALATAISVFIDRGLPVTQKGILTKFGMTPPEEGEPLLHAAQKGGGAVGLDDGTSSHDIEEPEEPEQVTKPGVRIPATKEQDSKNIHDDAERRSMKTDPKAGSKMRRVLGKASTGDFQIALARQSKLMLTDELVQRATGGWRRTVGPLLEQIKTEIGKAKDAGDCLKRLAKLNLNKDELTAAIAETTFLARAVGDAGKR